MKELVPLRGGNIVSHAHKTGLWYLLGVLFKISDKYPSHLYLEVPSGCDLCKVLIVPREAGG